MSASQSAWVQGRVWMVLSLVIVCIAAAVGLARVYGVTKPVIDQQKIDAVNQALAAVLPGTDHFEEQVPGELWYGFDAQDVRTGAVVRVAPRGYAGPVETLAGVGLDGLVTGIVITSLKETPGLGLKATQAWFRDQFRGKPAAELKLDKDGGTLDAISAATITSRAVTNGVREGIEKYLDRLLPAQPGMSDTTGDE
ncbi:FMN-binding protein [candidate division WOR-3 bacterium]|nr:FMN-binding protein [candidate division WOR-3 bacterium]